jgi:hypothetical protein
MERSDSPRRGDPEVWTGGTIYDPLSGRTYAARLALDGDDRLEIRGYVGLPVLGRTTTWIRVGSEGRACARRHAAARDERTVPRR